jgi:hypothetical protein
MQETLDRPLAVVTGATSGIGYEPGRLGWHALPDPVVTQMHRKQSEPGSGHK